MLHDTKGTKKYIEDIASSRERNIVYFIFFELGDVGKNGRKNIGGCWKGPIFSFKAIKDTKNGSNQHGCHKWKWK